jgi:hypothetical protein
MPAAPETCGGGIRLRLSYRNRRAGSSTDPVAWTLEPMPNEEHAQLRSSPPTSSPVLSNEVAYIEMAMRTVLLERAGLFGPDGAHPGA